MKHRFASLVTIFTLIAMASSYAHALAPSDITTGKEALELISRDAFADQRLESIKKKYIAGEEVNLTIEFPGKSYGFAPNAYFVETSSRELTVMYSLTGTNYDILRTEVKERTIKQHRQDGIYSSHFDITLMDVAKRAKEIGLEDKTAYANKVGELAWSWSESGYKCTLLSSINTYGDENNLSYTCTYKR
jgi:hypothetical protein